jgi:peptidoglycan/LPS O-acetylase OafA/YrhL
MIDNPINRLAGLDLLRFLCALAVVLHHYKLFNSSPGAPIVGAFNASLLGAPGFFAEYGRFAVQVFWAISGFIFFWKYADAAHARAVSPTEFLALRFSRLYPLHLATLLIVAGLQALYTASHGQGFYYGPNDALHFVLQLALASNWLIAPQSFNGPIWSVSAEAVVYVAFFFLVRRFRPDPFLCLAAIVAVMFIQSPATVCAFYFFAGGLLERLLRQLDDHAQKRALWLSALAAPALIATGAAGLVGVEGLIAPLALSAVALFALCGKLTARGQALFSRLGDLTFASYLIHFPLILTLVLLADRFGFDHEAFLHPIPYFAYAALVFALAWAAHWGFERPAQNALRGALLRRRRVGVVVGV